MGGDSGIRTLSRVDRRALSMWSSPYRRPDSCEPHEYSDGTHVKEPSSVACRIAGSVGTHPDWVRGAILLLGFMFAMRWEEHTSARQSLLRNSYAVLCLK